MKHIYNPTITASTQWPNANATGTALASNVFKLLFVCFFLLVSGESVGQGATPLYSNDFSSTNGLLFPNPTTSSRGTIGITNGELQAMTVNGNAPGYNRYVAISSQSFQLKPGYTYTVSFQGRANNQNGAVAGNVSVSRGNTAAIAASQTLGTLISNANVTVIKDATFRNYSITFTAGANWGNQYIALNLSSAEAQNSHIYLDNLTISETCLPAPQVADASTCRSSATLTLTASSTVSGGSFKWYRADQIEIVGETNSTLVRTLDQTTTFYVSKVQGACESEKVPVTAYVGTSKAPVVTPSIDCPGNKVTLTATGAQTGESYRWYDVAQGGIPIGNTATIERMRSNQFGTIYAVIVKSQADGGCESERTPVTITKAQTPTSPVIQSSYSRCGEGAITLTAAGAEPGENYLWYTSSTGTAIASGPSFTTTALSEESTVVYYVSKINTVLGCESSRVPVTTRALPFINIGAGSIAGPTNPEVGKEVVYGYNININESNILTRKWLLYFRDRSEPLEVQSGLSPTFTVQSVSPDLIGVEVVLTLAEGICYTVANANGEIEINNLQITPLPVELVSFKAQRHTKGVNLTWATASELDNKGFEVQVSTNSKDFTAIGFVESKVGTTSIRQEYRFLDTKAVSGTRYYRLKQIDFDGKFEYSAIRAVVLDGGNGAVAAYPNPFEDVVVVKLNGTEARRVSVMLTNSMGKVILEQEEETAGNTIAVDMSGVSAKGMYILHVLDNGSRHTFKLMKR